MASSIYHNEAVVTLTAINPSSSFSFPSRRIVLTKSKPTIFIGRTSKRNSSFEASESNAWIDSAVMSRDHAELRFDHQEQKVLIKDIGSLHGTFHNNSRLGLNQVQALKDGDMIQFGIAIDRGYETFPPCTMETAVKFESASPRERAIVFRVPDDTDVEELSSDEDIGIRHSSQILRENRIIPAQFQSTSTGPVVAIDLTSTEDVDCQTINPGEAPLESHSQEAGAPQSGCLDADKDISGSSKPRMPTPPGTIEISDEELFCEEGYLDDDDDDFDEDASDDDQDHSSEVNDLPEEDLPDETMHEDMVHDSQGASTSLHQFSPIQHCAPQHIVMEDPVKDMQLGHEPGNVEHCFQHSNLPPIMDYSKAALFPDWIGPAIQNKRLPPIFEAIPQATEASSSRSIAEILGEKTGKYEYFSAREANKMNAQKLAPIPAEDQLMPASLASPEAILAPRDMNSRGYDKEPEAAIEPCQETPSKAPEPDTSTTSPTEQVAQSLAMQSNSLLVSGVEFLNSPLKEHCESISVNPPVFDETSAYQFEITKKAIVQQKLAAENVEQYSEAQKAQQQLENQRCRMEINQIVHVLSNAESPEQSQTTTPSNKRKAADISQTTPEEELVELVNRTPPSPIPTNKPNPAECIPLLPSTSTGSGCGVSSRECDHARPAKRLQKVAEIFGYAALGGVAAISALIATAPTL